MSGYDMDRFPALSETEKTELTCGICLAIFRNPMVTNCCLQTYCEDCIKDWLKSKAKCPYDRKKIKIDELRPAPRIVNNLLGKLQIRCENRDKGCEEVMKLDDLSQHMISCEFNIRQCKECLCVCTVRHDCLQQLLINREKDFEKIEKLESELKNETDIKNQEILSLRTERENLLKDVELLKEHHANVEGHRETLRLARRKIASSVIIGYYFDSELSKKIVDIVVNAVNTQNNIFNICEDIVEKLKTQFGNTWICFANNNHFGRVYCNSNGYITIQLGPIVFKIFKINKVA